MLSNKGEKKQQQQQQQQQPTVQQLVELRRAARDVNQLLPPHVKLGGCRETHWHDL